jgi:peptide/nickel transport system permease protein
LIAFFARRVLRACLLLVSVSVLCFVLFELSPGDYFVEARISSPVTAEAVEALRTQHGLNRSLPVKYADWLGAVIRGDWGRSLMYGAPAGPILWTRAGNTLLLAVPAMLLAWIIAIPLAVRGGCAGARTQSFLRGWVSFLNSVPDILIAIALLFFAAHSGLFPIGGMTSAPTASPLVWTAGADIAAHLTLPVAALVLTLLPPILGHGMSSVSEVAGSSFITAAHAHGVPRRRLIYGHMLPAAVNPLISLFGYSIGTLLSSSFVVEAAMGWPGIGRLLLEATVQRDIYLVIGAVVFSSVFLVMGNLIADILLYSADPRIRHV